MMKKWLLAILLLLLLVGISYYKQVRQHEQSESFFEAGRQAVTQELLLARQQLDSLKAELSDTVHSIAESLQVNEAHYLDEIDSLSYLVDSLENKLAQLDTKVKNLASKSTAKKSSSENLTHQSALKEKVIVYYKQRYKSLPKDLSEYEKRVALAEIREETAKHFKISLAELNKIRKSYKLNY